PALPPHPDLHAPLPGESRGPHPALPALSLADRADAPEGAATLLPRQGRRLVRRRDPEPAARAGGDPGPGARPRAHASVVAARLPAPVDDRTPARHGRGLRRRAVRGRTSGRGRLAGPGSRWH